MPDKRPDVPWSIHIVKIDRSREDLTLHSVVGQYPYLGMSTVSEQLKSLPPDWGRTIAAVNGDFFKSHRNYPGDPEGLQIMNGELVSAPDPKKVCFWLDPQHVPHRSEVTSQMQVTWPSGATTPFGLNEECEAGAAVLYTPAIGKATRTSGGLDLVLESSGQGPWLPLQAGQKYEAKVRSLSPQGNAPVESNTVVLALGADLVPKLPAVTPGTVLKLSTATTPELTGVRTAIGGGPTLVADSKVRTLSGSQGRAPRTALGWNKNTIYLVVVDGRQRSIYVGMSLPELADYMARLGCEEAMNLDGGGSTTFWIYGNVQNSPSEGKERPAANALILVQEQKLD